MQTCLAVLAQWPRDPRPEHLVPLLRLLRRSLSDPRRVSLRSAALALINRQADAALVVREAATDLASLQRAYRPVFAWFEQRHPQWAAALVENGGEDPARWND